jgi:hypothetical protein
VEAREGEETVEVLEDEPESENRTQSWPPNKRQQRLASLRIKVNKDLKPNKAVSKDELRKTSTE